MQLKLVLFAFSLSFSHVKYETFRSICLTVLYVLWLGLSNRIHCSFPFRNAGYGDGCVWCMHAKSGKICKFLLLHCCCGNCKRRNKRKYAVLQETALLEIFHLPVIVGLFNQSNNTSIVVCRTFLCTSMLCIMLAWHSLPASFSALFPDFIKVFSVIRCQAFRLYNSFRVSTLIFAEF